MKTPINFFDPNKFKKDIQDEAAEDAVDIKSVREGTLERKQKVNKDKDFVKEQKNKALTNADANDVSLGLDSGSSAKQIRSEKRRRMQDIRDKEIGAKRTDRRNRRVERIANRNNITTEEARKYYDTRMQTMSAYNVTKKKEQDATALDKEENSNDDVVKNLLFPETKGGKNMKTNSSDRIYTFRNFMGG